MLDLQRDAGNRAVAVLLQRDKTDAADSTKQVEAEYRSGAKAYAAGQFGVAADFFTKADELRHMPEISFSWAQALRRAGGHADEAIALFQRYIDELPTGKRVKDAADFIVELAGVEPSGDEKTDRTAAERTYRKAEKAYAKGDFMVAADSFGQADALLHLPEITFSWGQALRRGGGHADEAIAKFQCYLDELPKGNRAKDAADFIAQLQGPEKSGDDTVDRAAAKRVYRKGEKAFNAGEFMAAADFFEQADAVYHVPEIRFSRGQALRRAGGHAEEAIADFQSYLDELPGGNRAKDAADFIALIRQHGAAT